MDSKDSSLTSSTLMATSRDGGSLAEDEGVLSVPAALAKDASLSFHSGKFAECIDVLNQLLQKKEDDPKVLHNVAIAKYFLEGCSDPKKLIEVLTNIKKRSDDLAYASGEQVEAVSNSGNKAILGSKGTNNVPQQLTLANSLHIGYGDELDTSVMMLNIAVILFHLHEYAKASSILDTSYKKIEPIDEATALHICLLFLDVALAMQDPWKFIDVMNYVEKAYCVGNITGQSDSGSSAQQQSSNTVPKSSSLPMNTAISDASTIDSAATGNTSEGPLSRTLSEENLENLISTIDMAGQSITRSSSLLSSNEILRTPADHYISTNDLRLKLHLYKVQFLLFTRNLKAAKREIKIAMAMNVASGKDSSVALLLKSQLEYARGNYRKAIKLLMASSNRTELGISSIYNNNLGCIYYRLGKYHTSAIFFSKALSNSSLLRKESPLKLATFSQDKSLQITYNCGVQYLACGKPLLAARCFHKASLIFYDRPLLWLRIAECCLMALEKGLLKSSLALPDRSEVKVHVIGNGKWRQLAMEDWVAANGQAGFISRGDWVFGDDKQPELSVSLAKQCLLNALYLLNSSELKCLNTGSSDSSSLEENESREAVSSESTNHKTASGPDPKGSILAVGSTQMSANGDAKEQKSGNSPNASLNSSISDYEDICRKENQMIKQALLADLSYVELELGNPLKALSTARSLLQRPDCSKIYIFLSNVYAAESLCLLNRPEEAAEHLLSYLSNGGNVELPYNDEDCEQWRLVKTVDCEESSAGSTTAKNNPRDESQDFVFLKPQEARGTLYANLAALSAMQGDLEQAYQFVVQALSLIPNSLEAILTAIYVDLVSGKVQEALAGLKRCSRVRFVPGSSLALKSSC